MKGKMRKLKKYAKMDFIVNNMKVMSLYTY